MNGTEKCFILIDMSEKVNKSLLRYGSPDMLFLGTQKNKLFNLKYENYP